LEGVATLADDEDGTALLQLEVISKGRGLIAASGWLSCPSGETGLGGELGDPGGPGLRVEFSDLLFDQTELPSFVTGLRDDLSRFR